MVIFLEMCSTTGVQIFKKYVKTKRNVLGAIRTRDLLLRRRPLYPTELRGQKLKFYTIKRFISRYEEEFYHGRG